MRERSFRWWFCLLFVLGFITVMAVESKADYTRNPDLIPTDADLTLITGRANTVVIRLLNLTPYNVVQDPSHITAQSFTDTNRKTHKSGMFAPVGWPGDHALRGLSGSWGKVPSTGNNIFTPDRTNTWVHPYNFVVTWDDQGGYVENSMMGWTIQNVKAAGLGPDTKNIPFRMWFTRIKPENALKGDLFQFISSFVIFGVDLIGVIVDPVNPIAWIDMFVATSEIEKQGFELSNSEETGGDKMYFAAYVAPEGTVADPNCEGCKPSVCTTDPEGTTDAVDVQWGTDTGSYSSEIVVTTEVLRGKDPYPNDLRQGINGYTLPIISVTLWTPEQYKFAQTQGAAAILSNSLGLRLRGALGTRDTNRFTQFAYIYNSLDKQQKKIFEKIIHSILFKKHLSHDEETFIEKLITAMNTGQFTLNPKKH